MDYYLDLTVFGLADSPNTWLLLFVVVDDLLETGVLLHSNTASFSQSFSIYLDEIKNEFHSFYLNSNSRVICFHHTWRLKHESRSLESEPHDELSETAFVTLGGLPGPENRFEQTCDWICSHIRRNLLILPTKHQFIIFNEYKNGDEFGISVLTR